MGRNVSFARVSALNLTGVYCTVRSPHPFIATILRRASSYLAYNVTDVFIARSQK